MDVKNIKGVEGPKTNEKVSALGDWGGGGGEEYILAHKQEDCVVTEFQ